VILVNEFPDFKADAAVNKRTLVVIFGVPVSVWIYRITLAVSFIVATSMLVRRSMFFAGLLYLITLPIAVVAMKSVNKKDLVKPGQFRASQITVLLHSAGTLSLALGFIVFRLFDSAVC